MIVFPSAASTEPAPKSVRRAVYLMYAGAAVYLISGVVGLVSLVTAGPTSPSALHVPALLDVVAVLSIVVPIVLWPWMAWKCRAGRPWARILSTVFFGLATVVTLASGPYGAWGLAGAMVGWFVGLGAVILLWQRSSSPYFRAGRI
ncbi:MAG TPA: hypothetical protein VEV45_01705 [Streptosporangiaceae bacterium]|nr:hypothetical protein [Streptosporangiaceae bacterium]